MPVVKTKWFPGPYKVMHEEGRTHVTDEDGVALAQLSDVEITVEEVEATATLFKTSPLLYEALLAMMEESAEGTFAPGYAAVTLAKRALAEATGEVS